MYEAWLELFLEGEWLTVASFRCSSKADADQGYRGSGLFSYDEAYTAKHLGDKGLTAVSCRYPVSFDMPRDSHWPAFLLDLLPSGAGRRYGLEQLKVPDGPTSDWPLLLSGAWNVPGNLRVRTDVKQKLAEGKSHPGFARRDILDRKEEFLEYAKRHGAPVAGSTGAQGDAPKFLLTQDHRGKWHADGALPDERAARHWIVKFPRGKQRSDRVVLKNEAAYLRVAKAMGLRVGELLEHEENVLFIPRFDREVIKRKVLRHGQESVCSLAGVAEFGAPVRHEVLCEAIAWHSTDPKNDLREYIFRDVLNFAMGNTDNHARNTAVSKFKRGKITLSPLYDFAPMFLDDEGIARVCRWDQKIEGGASPDWGQVTEEVSKYGINAKALRAEMVKFAAKVGKLPELMRKCKVDDAVVERLVGKIEDVAKALRGAKPR